MCSATRSNCGPISPRYARIAATVLSHRCNARIALGSSHTTFREHSLPDCSARKILKSDTPPQKIPPWVAPPLLRGFLLIVRIMVHGAGFTYPLSTLAQPTIYCLHPEIPASLIAVTQHPPQRTAIGGGLGAHWSKDRLERIRCGER